MKTLLYKTCLLFILLFFSLYAHAQTLPASFLKKYNSAKTDVEKGKCILYSYADNNSTMNQSLILLSYFNKQNDDVGIDYTKLIIDISQSTTGDFTNSLKESFEILARFEKRKDEFGRMMSLSSIANAFAASKNYDNSIAYYKKELSAAKFLNDSNRFINTINDIGYTYALANIPDSGLVYAQQAVNLSDTYGFNKAYSLSTLGENYMVKREYDKALPILRESYTYIYNDAFATASILSDFVECFVALNKKDSAMHYAQMAIVIADKSKFNDALLRTYESLYKFFDKTSNGDSSNKYFRLATAIKDTIYNIEKIKVVEGITFKEQLRQQEEVQQQHAFQNKIKLYSLIAGLIVFLLIAILLYRNNQHKQKANALLQHQKAKVEIALSELKSTQAQLIQSEKMASLGELTAGIAHEIQNPLNFVNNFSEVNKEMLIELNDEIEKGNYEDAKAIAKDVIDNEEKINHHGKRADAIVKGMLQHSRTNTGKKEPTDINALADEYLRLSYHGLRAKDKNFNADIKTDFDNNIGKINIIPQDIGRVLLNLFNNAFYSLNEKRKTANENYQPTVSVQTKKINDKIEIRVEDNGNGIPQNIIDKVFQPFFTTKPTGEGTGLGLSLAYDIIKAHGGEIKVETKEYEGSTFVIKLPTNENQ